ncbi:hypothetical protein AKJ09_06084 [Labilithrix luteola]|uniref:Prepilin-type N-terminal cleavage/methylation domain-containing protein n=1 Tax=Labilithrix luteola TaxID=1391654 RepID=A0A0K1Q0V9_9BACT|nr:hypothetical protein AKJ09_06084 [Labilithrix luteola]
MIRRAKARREAGGFTLLELMVVVLIVAMLAMMAVPNMAAAREDRLAFREADMFAKVIHVARTRALARGAAQLVTITSNGVTDRGSILSYEGLNAQGRPQSPCKIPGSWSQVPGGGPLNPLIGGENLNASANSLQVKAGLETVLTVDGQAQTAVAMCFTPGGRVYLSAGATVAAAVGNLPTTQPFTGDLNLAFQRKPAGSTRPVGLVRNVIMTPTGATRIRSQ